MASVTFDQLVHLYRNSTFRTETGDEAELTVADESVINTLKILFDDADLFEDAGVQFRLPKDLSISMKIPVKIRTPILSIGLFVRSVEDLLKAREHRTVEPTRYYVSNERFAYDDQVVPDAIKRYRGVISLVGCLSQAAALVDEPAGEAIFLAPGKVKLSYIFSFADLAKIDTKLVERLKAFVDVEMHKDQRMAILSSNIIEMCGTVSENERFRHIIQNLALLTTKSQDAYKLFAAEFSYDKIRGKTEEALNEYSNKIHKTFFDIQNQIIGIPVATIVVATQMKSVAACTSLYWGNLGIAVGATVFAALLLVAVSNQWMTLNAIRADLTRQSAKLEAEYISVADQFKPIYDKLGHRITIHRRILAFVIAVCVVGALSTWYVFWQVTTADCI
ncbi:hypothetical protein ACDA55_07720 [Rhizobium ruizarguesonis]